MSPGRLTMARLRRLAEQLPARYTAVLPHLDRARVLTGNHLDQLMAEPGTSEQTTARVRRRIMGRLCDLGIVDTLERRIGGVRAGSAGHVYTLTTAGHKLLALLGGEQPSQRVRHSSAPGTLFLAHALAISEIYVHLIQASRGQDFRVATFVTEPHSWWPQGDGTFLRPDAYTLLATSTHQDCWWLEIDQGTESITRIRDKCRTYIDFLASGGVGPDDALPRILFTTPDPYRAEVIAKEITKMIASDTDLMASTTHEDAARLVIGELHTA